MIQVHRPVLKSALLRLIFVALCSLCLLVAANAQSDVLQVSSTPFTGVTITNLPADITGTTSGVTNYTLRFPAGPGAAILTAPLTVPAGVFSNWIIDGVAQASGVNIVTLSLTGADTAIAVYFPNLSLTVQSTKPSSGVAIGAAPLDATGLGNGTTTFVRSYAQGTNVTLTAPATAGGNAFDHWVVGGVAEPVGQTAVTFGIFAATTATAQYVAPVPITVQSQNPASGVAITAAPADEGGLTGGATTFTLNYPAATAVFLTAPATSGASTFDHWSLGGVAQPVGQTTVQFVANAATTAIAIYKTTFTVTASVAGANGTINPSGVVTLPGGANQTFTGTPAAGFMVGQWTLDGAVAQTGGLTFAVNAIAANHTLTVSFVAVPPVTFTITASATGTHGTVSPTGSVTVTAGANQLFTAAPSAGWMVKQWTLDGAVVQSGGNTYTVKAVAANHTLAVSFAVTIVFHPGDTNNDGRVEVAEVTAYASAWKRGNPWPNAPSPIPQSYVTNLIMLWKTGELYTNDPSKAAPDTWVPIALAPTIAQPATSTANTSSSNSIVIRQSDGSWLVNITIKPATGTKAYTLEENIPVGAKVVVVSAGGVYDAKGRVIRWGPFMDDGTRILSYRIMASSAVTLSGAASFDGKNVTTTGTRKAGGKS